MNDKEAIEALQGLREYCQSHNCYTGECPLLNFCNYIWVEGMYSLEEAVIEGLEK